MAEKKKNRQTPEARRTSLRKYSQKLRNSIVELLGGHCIQCGFTDRRALQVDHISGGGHEERRKFGNGRVFYLNVRRNPEKYQLLCANCNWIKREVNREYRKF